MKLSTYLMCAMFACGLIGTTLFTVSHMTKQPEEEYEPGMTLGGETITVPLGEVSIIDYVETKSPRNIKIKNYKGIAVCESDTARSAWLVTTTDWLPFLRAEVDNKALTLSLERQLIAERFEGCDVVSARDYVIATVVVPRGAVDNFYASTHTLYLDSIQASCVTATVADRLVIIESCIDSLLMPGKGPKELKFDNSKIGWISDTGAEWHRPGER